MNFNLKAALGSIAPTLATMLGGPLAGTAVTALEGALGLAPGAGTDEVTKVVPLSVSVTVIFASGINAPVESFTVPTMLPVSFCAKVLDANASSKRKSKKV